MKENYVLSHLNYVLRLEMHPSGEGKLVVGCKSVIVEHSRGCLVFFLFTLINIC